MKITGLAAICLLAASPAFADTAPDPFIALKARAESGDLASELALADQYANPASPHFNPDAAETWYLKAAATGNGGAQAATGYFYANGPKPDGVKALEWLKKAAAQHLEGTVGFLCTAYYTGLPWLTQDLAQAIPYCKEAADAHDLPAMRIQAQIVGRGQGGVAKDGAAALSLLQAVFDTSHQPADLLALAHGYYDGVYGPADYTKSFRLFHSVFKGQPALAGVELADHYDRGLGTDKEPNEAARLYLWEAAQGEARAVAWHSQHPEATIQALAANRISPTDLQAGVYVRQIPGPSGTVSVPAGPDFSTDIGQYYPARAQESEVEGSSTIECHITLAGDFDNCLALDETPPGYGFLRSTQRILAFIKTPDFSHKDDFAKTYGGKSFMTKVGWRLQ